MFAVRPKRYPYHKKPVQRQAKNKEYKFINIDKSLFVNYHLEIVKSHKGVEINIRI